MPETIVEEPALVLPQFSFRVNHTWNERYVVQKETEKSREKAQHVWFMIKCVNDALETKFFPRTNLGYER